MHECTERVAMAFHLDGCEPCHSLFEVPWASVEAGKRRHHDVRKCEVEREDENKEHGRERQHERETVREVRGKNGLVHCLIDRVNE